MFDKLKGLLKKIQNALVKFFTSDEWKRIEKGAAVVADLLQKALPVVKLVAAMTPTKADDEVIALIEKYALPINFDPTQPLQEGTKYAALRAAAACLLKGELTQAVLDAGAEGILLGGFELKSVKDVDKIPTSYIDEAVQSAYRAWKDSVTPSPIG